MDGVPHEAPARATFRSAISAPVSSYRHTFSWLVPPTGSPNWLCETFEVSCFITTLSFSLARLAAYTSMMVCAGVTQTTSAVRLQVAMRVVVLVEVVVLVDVVVAGEPALQPSSRSTSRPRPTL